MGFYRATLVFVDIQELQKLCKAHAGEAEARQEQQTEHRKTHTPKVRPPEKWDRFVVFPEQYLSKAEFARLLEAYREKQQVRRVMGYLERSVAQDEYNSDRASAWKRKIKRR